MQASGSDYVRLAEALARVQHIGQTRAGSGEPYFNHVARVAERVNVGGWRGTTIAYLHDLLEDTSMTPLDLRHMGFDWGIVDDVTWLSRGEEPYLDYIEQLARKASDDALYVKLADLADNLSDSAPGSLRARYIKADVIVRAALWRRGASLPEPVGAAPVA